jgi:hypothetical protein
LTGTHLFEATLIIHKTAIITYERSIRGILTYKIPTMLRRGRRTRSKYTGKTSFSSPLILPHEFKVSGKSCLYPRKKIVKVEANIATINGITDKGCERPRTEYNSLTNNPINIENAILKPTENKIISRKLIFFSLRSLRSPNPGTNDR